MFKNVKKILVIKLRHIGDVLLTVPAIRALRETFPDSHISVLVNTGTEEVLEGNTSIHELITFDRSIKNLPATRRFMREAGFLKWIRAKNFDMTVDLTSGDRAAVISRASGARYRIARDTSGAGFPGKRYMYTHLAGKTRNKHMVLQNLDVLGQFGITTDNTEVDFYIPPENRLTIRKVLEENSLKRGDRIVHVHPTSRWFFKCWKDEYMAEVIRWLIDNGSRIIVTSAPDSKELEKAENILSLCMPHSVQQMPRLLNLCGKTTIKELAAISEASDIFIGVDSAPMHIAAAVKTPVIALFGPTGENDWRPYGNGHLVLTKNLPCKPCKQGMCEDILLRECMTAIKPDEVKKAVSKVLNNKK